MKLLKKHWKIILQLLLIFLMIIGAKLLITYLPGNWRYLAEFIVNSIWVILLGTIIVFMVLQIIQNFRLERSFIPDRLKIKPFPMLKHYRIINPLEGPGDFYKTQLHTHSNLSYDCKVAPEEIIASYQQDGYKILAITDHDRFSDFSNLSTEEMLILPGVEEVVPVLFWPIPLGKHLVLINPLNKRPHSETVQRRLDQTINFDSLVIPAHLSWRGGAGTGRWYPEALYKLKNLQFIEIHNPHSNDPLDLVIWHKLIIKSGPQKPVWGIAVDDSHRGSSRHGWIMVKTPGFDLRSVIQGLKKGAFYATTGPSNLDIRVEGTKIHVSAPGATWIRFFNAQNQVIWATRASEALYQSYGDEGFIRIEVKNEKGRTAWSQPMWLVSEAAGERLEAKE